MIGTRLGSYEVTAKLGEGGMGEVWRATDTKLKRDVAIKVLPAAFTEDTERLARFEREAQLLAQLHHPNIASIFGLEDAGDTRALVMELVEGPTLAERLEQRALPLSEVLAIAKQIAEAIEEAHEKGIVHRDLKPQNVKASIEGKVKVLDFGLAKALDPVVGTSGSAPASELAASPTLTLGATQMGVILGTAAYMAPEQAKGMAVDKRADIWAFGVVLWEMLCGRRLFEGDTVPETLAGVLKSDIDLDALPEPTPGALRRLLRRCLERNPKNRLHDIADARIVLEELAAGGEDETAPRAAPLRGRARLWRLVPWATTALLAVAVTVVVAMLASRGGTAPAPAIAATIPPPPSSSFYLLPRGPGGATISRDGARTVFAAVGADSVVRLWVRETATGISTALPGTGGAQYPFWSPDGRWVAFFSQSDGTLKKVSVDGGSPLTICEAPNGKGGSWSAADEILFAPGPGTPIHRVPAAGGTPVAVTEIDRTRHNSHRHPRFLPDREHFLFFARSSSGTHGALMLASLAGGPPRELVASVSQGEIASGHLLFVREGSLLAQPFDLRSLELSGAASVVATDALEIANAAVAFFSVSDTGLLLYHSGAIHLPKRLQLVNREGRLLREVAEPAESFRDMEFSPDGRQAVYSKGVLDDLYLLDLETGAESRLTLSQSEDMEPVWSPDGRTLYFSSNRSGPHDIYRLTLDGGGQPELLLDSPGVDITKSITPDGTSLLFARMGESDARPWRLDLASGEAELVLDRPMHDSQIELSPDGRWLVFVSSETGRREVFAVAFPGPGRTVQISTAGGDNPTWSGVGDEIFYLDLSGRVMAVAVETSGGNMVVRATRNLFQSRPPTPDSKVLAAAPDGQTFLIFPESSYGAPNELRLLVGWESRLGKR